MENSVKQMKLCSYDFSFSQNLFFFYCFFCKERASVLDSFCIMGGFGKSQIYSASP